MPFGQADSSSSSAPPESSEAAAAARAARRRRLLIEYLIIAVLAVGLALLVQAYVVKPYRIPSPSMETTLQPGDRVFVNRFIYHFRDVRRGDIVVFHAPGSGAVLIKRVVGLPGDTITLRAGRVLVNDHPLDEPYVRRLDGRVAATEPFPTGEPWSLAAPYTVPTDSYFMMGDNRENSGDSREFGPVPRDSIIGDAFFIYWPMKRISVL